MRVTESDVIEAWREATPPGASLAARMYAADMESMRLRDDVWDVLESACGADAVDDFTADYYDRSIELRMAATASTTLSAVAVAALADAGFRLAWVHSPVCGERCACQPISLAGGDDAD